MDKRKQQRDGKTSAGKSSAGRSASQLRLRKLPGENAWEFVHPRCALDRADDLEEVRKMVEADELDIAIDELRWLLNGCGDFIDAHKTLGELALLDNDIPLARGHFGYAVQIGQKAIAAARCDGPVPYRLPANAAFHEAGKGLAFCLRELGKPKLLSGVVNALVRCDPTDPLAIRELLTPKPTSAPPGLTEI